MKSGQSEKKKLLNAVVAAVGTFTGDAKTSSSTLQQDH
jgi:hypothetical protein